METDGFQLTLVNSEDKTTDHLTAGESNLYYTETRVKDNVDNKCIDTSNYVVNLNDTANTWTCNLINDIDEWSCNYTDSKWTEIILPPWEDYLGLRIENILQENANSWLSIYNDSQYVGNDDNDNVGYNFILIGKKKYEGFQV